MDIEWDVMGYALEEFFAWQREIRENPFVFFSNVGCNGRMIQVGMGMGT